HTITHYLQAALPILIKHVINDNGGNNSAADFTISVSGFGATPSSFPGDESGTVVTLDANSAYSVTETGPAGYTESDSIDCTGTLDRNSTPPRTSHHN